jgi:hypothetical protein
MNRVKDVEPNVYNINHGMEPACPSFMSPPPGLTSNASHYTDEITSGVFEKRNVYLIQDSWTAIPSRTCAQMIGWDTRLKINIRFLRARINENN